MSEVRKCVPGRALPQSEVEHWDLELDVAVVGFGGAGSCAAIEAARAGADVHVFEAFSAAGGSTALSGGEVYLGGSGGTRIQRLFGFEDSTENLFEYLMMQQAPLGDEAKILAYAENASEHFDWLVEQGVPFKESFLDERLVEPLTDDCLIYSGNEKAWPEITRCKPVPRGHAVKKKGMGAGAVLMEHLVQVALEVGAKAHYDSRVLCLIQDDEGAVTGLIVRQDGRELAVRARGGVILCAGGFAMNEEMVREYAPHLLKATDVTGNPGDTGAGIQMGLSVGGRVLNMSEGFCTLPFYPPATLTYGIIINDKGQRFINEDAYHGRVGVDVLTHNSERFYLIADVSAYGSYESFNFMGAEVAATGESIEELEQELGLPEQTLVNTLNLYNRFAEQGEDPLFHKQPEWLRPLELPLVALDVTPGRGAFYSFFTLGGLDTLPTGEVRRIDGEIVPGLYAAGRTAAGVPRRGRGYNSGISVGDATFSGRRAGMAAAARRQSA